MTQRDPKEYVLALASAALLVELYGDDFIGVFEAAERAVEGVRHRQAAVHRAAQVRLAIQDVGLDSEALGRRLGSMGAAPP